MNRFKSGRQPQSGQGPKPKELKELAEMLPDIYTNA